MKVRMGFISNSSSASFCIYGVALEENDIQKFIKEDSYELYKKANQNGLEYYAPNDFDAHYIGLGWSCVKDNETGKQFKERVEQKLKEVFGITQKCDTHQEAWRDG